MHLLLEVELVELVDDSLIYSVRAGWNQDYSVFISCSFYYGYTHHVVAFTDDIFISV